MSAPDVPGPLPVGTFESLLVQDEASAWHLRVHLEVLEGRVVRAVARRRARRTTTADERFRGMFLSDADIDGLLLHPGGSEVRATPDGPESRRVQEGDLEAGTGDAPAAPADGGDLLERTERAVDVAEADGAPTRLRRLQRRFGLTALDLDLLLVALAPDIDARFERLYAYLHDDLTRRRATIGLSLELAGADAMDARARAALTASGHLVPLGLVEIEDDERPFLSRTLRVPDRVTAFLLGSDAVDPTIEPYLAATVAWPGADSDRIVGALRSGSRLFYAHERPGASGSSIFGAALAEVGLKAVEIDLSVLAGSVSAADLVPAVLREVGLSGAGLILGHADDLARKEPHALRRFCEAPAVVCLVGRSSWDPEWARILPYVVEVPAPPMALRADVWTTVIGTGEPIGELPGLDRVASLRMTPLQVVNVVDWARRRAASESRTVVLADIEAGVRNINSAPLERLSTRVAPRASWDDLVLAPPIERTVHKVAARARHRELVQDVWGVGGSSGRRGTIALFSGPPGTGKTLAAEVIAGELGVDLYIVDLATVVDKYIGETEKNLERIFRAAEEVNGLLFFDEADAIFGKRSEVKDARDRYANVEVAYLLQRLERFDGVVVLATNLSSNVDEAFSRRLDVAVDFKLPGIAERRLIWGMSLPETLPRSEDVDIEFLADAFAMSGGSIRNICLEAAYLAAEDVGEVTMEHIIRAAALEHRKLGLLIASTEFRQYYAVAQRELAS